MSIFILARTGTLLRQFVPNGNSFTGVRTDDPNGPGAPTIVAGQQCTGLYAVNAGDGEGLFEFDTIIAAGSAEKYENESYPLHFVRHARVIVGAGVTWTVSMTVGDKSTSTAGSDIDTKTHDVVLASGTGNASVFLDQVVPPRACIRFETAATNIATPMVEVFMQPLDSNEVLFI